jgi:hypothetical protein
MNPLILIKVPPSERKLHTLNPNTGTDFCSGNSCFFPKLASSSIFGAFAMVYSAAWNLPPAGAVAVKRVTSVN